jgi:hypothetical protein
VRAPNCVRIITNNYIVRIRVACNADVHLIFSTFSISHVRRCLIVLLVLLFVSLHSSHEQDEHHQQKSEKCRLMIKKISVSI